ncbi:phosphoribosylamine--glycine ligase [Pontibacillus yanchengensis]|uniref:Phosphoribosylamine--glycine ligase n=1 Tax=Pontibacillus yanchengensis Y32 TaxID=1385514 RepID=A0A0A2TA91_9BACI|nr:phosphoribosylamine--glycine ligase [Pontibacillus yanchengensis]KGP71318.1 phosphoribosylamine--glycine ligase [Pontibacillus yanchengensis Y32]
MNILVVGGGGREHSIVQALLKSDKVQTVYAAPGNYGMTEAEIVPISATDPVNLIEFAREKEMDLTIVGPEIPLLDGVVNAFQEAGLKVFGPTQEAALIEGSKAYAKTLMEQYDIPTASYQTCTSTVQAKDYVVEKGAPIVVKADGLAAGKGVTVAMTQEEAFQAIDSIMEDEQFGSAGSQVVVEEFLDGEEFSLMAFVNGEEVYPMIPAQDHKRAFDGDEGPNTGGMGAYAPVPSLSESYIEEAIVTILKPTARALVQEGRPFTGILYAGCIKTDKGPKVIEFNARFGDPETQVVLPLMENDLLQVVEDVMVGKDPQLSWKEAYCAGVVLASEGYPGSYEKGNPVPELPDNQQNKFTIYAGVSKHEDRLVSNGGRVLLVGALAPTLKDAVANVYDTFSSVTIDEDAFFYRKDIAHKALNSSASCEYK